MLNAGLVSKLEETGTLQQIKSHEQTDREVRDDGASTAINSEDTSQADGETNGEPLAKVPSKAQARKFVEEEARENTKREVDERGSERRNQSPSCGGEAFRDPYLEETPSSDVMKHLDLREEASPE